VREPADHARFHPLMWRGAASPLAITDCENIFHPIESTTCSPSRSSTPPKRLAPGYPVIEKNVLPRREAGRPQLAG
jgi:hypothetical protein